MSHRPVLCRGPHVIVPASPVRASPVHRSTWCHRAWVLPPARPPLHRVAQAHTRPPPFFPLHGSGHLPPFLKHPIATAAPFSLVTICSSLPPSDSPVPFVRSSAPEPRHPRRNRLHHHRSPLLLVAAAPTCTLPFLLTSPRSPPFPPYHDAARAAQGRRWPPRERVVAERRCAASSAASPSTALHGEPRCPPPCLTPPRCRP
jgi:hypothetical protein